VRGWYNWVFIAVSILALSYVVKFPAILYSSEEKVTIHHDSEKTNSVLEQSSVRVDEKYLVKSHLEPINFTSNSPFYDDNGLVTITRKGFLLKKPTAQATVLVCHGFMCDKFDSAFLRMIFPMCCNVMTFDFRAHGENVSEHQYCTFGRDEANDVIAAVNYLKSRPDIGHLPIVAFGFSMGAVAAIQAQAAYPNLFKAMILDCPYDHSKNVIKQGLENLKFSFFGYRFSLPGKQLLEQYAFHPYVQSFLKAVLKTVANMDATATNTYIYPVSPMDSIKNVKVPCLFIHCINDEKVPVSAAKNLFNGASGYKRLWLTLGRRHFDSFFYNPEKYVYKINRFIQKVLDLSLADKAQQKIKEDALIL